jgi:hypothetical protein
MVTLRYIAPIISTRLLPWLLLTCIPEGPGARSMSMSIHREYLPAAWLFLGPRVKIPACCWGHLFPEKIQAWSLLLCRTRSSRRLASVSLWLPMLPLSNERLGVAAASLFSCAAKFRPDSKQGKKKKLGPRGRNVTFETSDRFWKISAGRILRWFAAVGGTRFPKRFEMSLLAPHGLSEIASRKGKQA